MIIEMISELQKYPENFPSKLTVPFILGNELQLSELVTEADKQIVWIPTPKKIWYQ